ncbi:MAG: DUF6544 family protein [Candidatus Neomarinimicrobiota bacterium]
MNILITVLGTLSALGFTGWLGLQVPPKIEPAVAESCETEYITKLPDNLPAPVLRYLQTVFEDKIPVVKTAVFHGAPQARINGIKMRINYQVFYRFGGDYRRDMKVGWFGKQLIEGHELYINGVGKALIAGETESGPEFEQAFNISIWSEVVLMPSLLIQDERLRWEVVSDNRLKLFVPFHDQTDSLLIDFDPATGLVSRIEAQRPKNGKLVGWAITPQDWQWINGIYLPTRNPLQWADEKTPWTVWAIDDIRYNLKVDEKFVLDF